MCLPDSELDNYGMQDAVLNYNVEIKIKSSPTEALQYRRDLLTITTREHTSLSVHVVQKITIIRATIVALSSNCFQIC